jgi:hypothetical protein
VIDPKTILLLGGNTSKYVYRYFLGEHRLPALTNVMESPGNVFFRFSNVPKRCRDPLLSP